jgi:hypothetical protein
MRIELGQNWYQKIRSLSAIHAKYLLNQLRTIILEEQTIQQDINIV